MSDKFKAVITLIVIKGLVLLGLFIINRSSKKDYEERIDFVKDGYHYGKGLIVDIKHYKGHSIKIKYQVNHIDYTFNGGWDINPKGLQVGDSLKFKYAVARPEFILTELESEYDEL
ncbi:MAG: hypothetical protein J7577_05510 [Sphingobacteriaceae bacterium]|nr:hypothetical protein [Sphingobacteriaceae bacterium]